MIHELKNKTTKNLPKMYICAAKKRTCTLTLNEKLAWPNIIIFFLLLNFYFMNKEIGYPAIMAKTSKV